jgi:hypothetical protein
MSFDDFCSEVIGDKDTYNVSEQVVNFDMAKDKDCVTDVRAEDEKSITNKLPTMSADTAYSDLLKRSNTNSSGHSQRKYAPEIFGGALLRALLHKDVELIPAARRHGQRFLLYAGLGGTCRIEEMPKAPKPVDNPLGDDKVGAVMLEADNIRIKLNKDTIDPICVLAALVAPGVAFSYEQLKSFPVTQAELVSAQAESASSLHQAVFAPKAGSPDKAATQMPCSNTVEINQHWPKKES